MPACGYIDPDAPPAPYWDTDTYQIGAEWLADCAVIEDWGCGRGYFRTKVNQRSQYVGLDMGLDGLPIERMPHINPFVDKFVDLSTYTSQVEGIFMRHVLEHNHTWETLLDNAAGSFTKRMVLVLFTEVIDVGVDIERYGYARDMELDYDRDIPWYRFSFGALKPIFDRHDAVISDVIPVSSSYAMWEHETVLLLEKA